MEWDLASLRAVRSSTRENQSNERADNCRQANVQMQLFHLLPLGSIRPWRTRKKGEIRRQGQWPNTEGNLGEGCRSSGPRGGPLGDHLSGRRWRWTLSRDLRDVPAF